MAQVVIGIQCISILVLFAECWVVFKEWKSALHSYLFLSCVATLVNNVGYLFEMLSRSEEAYITALKLSYLGRVWISYALLLFIVELVGKKASRVRTAFLGLLNIAFYLSVVTTEYTGLYYRNMDFSLNCGFPDFSHDDGVCHHLFMALQILYICLGLVMLFEALKKERHEAARKRIFVVLLAILMESAFYLMQMFVWSPLVEVYDVTMLGYPIGTVFMLIAIFRYDLLDTRAIAMEYVIDELDELSDGIIATDPQGEVIYYNKPTLAIFPDLKTDAQDVVKRIQQAIGADEPVVRNERIYTPQKNALYHNGKEAGTVYALIDDTEHYRYMEELKEQKQIADDANKAKSVFLSNMSHEIRTPINAVLGMDEMILRESEEEDTLVYAGNIQTAGTTLLSLINDILDLSKIEAGKMDIIPVDYALAPMLKDLVNMIAPRAEAKGLLLHLSVDENLPEKLHGDEIRIKQIITNILTNAVKYTESGSVTLAVSYEKKDAETIALSVRVTDTGIGIKEEDIQKLFSPYERIEEERNRSIEGTGLGMNITKQLLSMMDSRLTVESVYGEGSTFSFAIAQGVVSWERIGDFSEELKKARSVRKRYRESFTAPEGRILVVDDTPMNLTVIQGLLKRTRLVVTTAEKGEEAIRLAKEKDFDVIFLDHLMPDMDGVETLYHLKKETPAGTKKTPVICLTANAVSGAKEEYLAAGFTDYLTKPIVSEQLEKMLIRYLPPEKVTLTEDAPQEQAGEAGKGLPPEVMRLTGVDVSSGVINCGSVDNYMAALKSTAGTIADTIALVEQTKDAGDWANFTIKVHAIKSSMRIIGASGLSTLAEGLEAAGNAQDTNRIEKDAPELLVRMRRISEELAEIFSDKKEEDLPLIEADKLEDAYAAIAEFVQAFDWDSIDFIIESLSAYRMPEEEKERFARLKAAAANLEAEEVRNILEG